MEFRDWYEKYGARLRDDITVDAYESPWYGIVKEIDENDFRRALEKAFNHSTD